MDEVFVALIVLAAALLIVTVVGHGLWIGLAAILRWLGGPREVQGETQRYCLECRRVRWFAKGRCTICGQVPAAPPLSSRESELAVAERQIELLFQAGKFTAEEHSRFLGVLRAERAGAVPTVAAALLSSTPPAVAATETPGEALEIEEFVKPALPVFDKQLDDSWSREWAPAQAPVAMPPEKTPVAPAALVQPRPVVERTVTELINRRTLTDLMQRFMEEKNIRWGEIVSGILIVGSAVGLVISLWATLQDSIPYFPALLFMLVTAALHAAGLYTLRKWKLKSVSRGLLVISTLLVPLNFFAAVLLVESRPVLDLLYAASVTVGFAVFGAITVSAGRVLMRAGTSRARQWWPLSLAVMGPSAAQLAISRLGPHAESTLEIALLGGTALACFLAAIGAQLALAARGAHLTMRRTQQTFLLLGIAVFSLLAPLGLLVWKTGQLHRTLAALSPWMSVAGAFVMAAGLVVHRRLGSAQGTLQDVGLRQYCGGPHATTNVRRAIAAPNAAVRTAGTAVLLMGVAGMLASVGLAWPRPGLLLVVGAVNFAALTTIAFAAGLAVLQPAAVVSGSLAVVVAYHMVRGKLHWGEVPPGRDMMGVLLLAESGMVSTGLAVIAAGVAGWLKRTARDEQAAGYFASAAGMAFVGLSMAVYAGFFGHVDAPLATPVLAVDAIAALLAARYWKRQPITWLASGAVFLAFWHALAWNEQVASLLGGFLPERPFVCAALLHATLVTLVALFTTLRKLEETGPAAEHGKGRKVEETSAGSVRSSRFPLPSSVVPVAGEANFSTPLAYSAIITSAAVLPALFTCREPQLLAHAQYTLWGAGVWFAAAVVLRSRLLFASGQVLSAIGLGALTTAICRQQSWWTNHVLDPRHVQLQIVALAIGSLAWVVARRGTLRISRIEPLTRRGDFAVDRAILFASVLAFAGYQAWACFPLIEPMIAFGRAPSGAATFLSLTGAASATAFAPAAWGVLAMIVAALVAQLWDRATAAALGFLMAAAAIVPMLLCGATNQPALLRAMPFFALNWGLAAYSVLLALLFAARRPLLALAGRFGFVDRDVSADESPGRRSLAGLNFGKPLDGLRVLSLALTLLPVLALTLLAALSMADGHVPADFANVLAVAVRVRAAILFAAPMWVLAAGLIVFAVRDRMPALVLAASVLLQLGVAILYLTPLWLQVAPIGAAEVLELSTWIALVLAALSLAWQASRRFIEPDDRASQPSGSWPLTLHLYWTSSAIAGLATWAAAGIFFEPDPLPASVARLGNAVSIAALCLAALSWLWHARRRGRVALARIGCGFAIAAVPFVAAAMSPWSVPGSWLSFHVLEGGWAALTLLLAASASLRHGRRAEQETSPAHEFLESEPPAARRAASSVLRWWAAALGGLVILMALRGLPRDPAAPWWSAGATLAVGVSAAAFAIRFRNNALAWSSTLCGLLAAAFVWSLPQGTLIPGLSAGAPGWLALFEIEVIALAVLGTIWLAVEVLSQRRRDVESAGGPAGLVPESSGQEFPGRIVQVRDRSPEFDPKAFLKVHHGAAVAGLLGCGFLVLGAFFAQVAWGRAAGPGLQLNYSHGWLMVEALIVLLAGSLWDRTASHAVGGLYWLGLIAVGAMLGQFPLQGRELIDAGGSILAAFLLATGLLWTFRKRLEWLGVGIGMAPANIDPASIARWLPGANLLLSAVSLSVLGWVVLTFSELPLRLWAAAATVMLPIATACFAQDERREPFAYLSTMLAAATAVTFGWAVMPFEIETHVWLHRAIRLVVVLAGATTVYGLVLVRVVAPFPSWFAAVRRSAVHLGAAAIASLLLVLALEAAMYVPGSGAPVTNPQIGAIAVVLVGLAAALISLAVLPGRDPLGLSERGRTVYVYAAEVVLALLFVHIRLTKPEFFSGYLLRYWPFIVMAIAFAGASVSEMFERLRIRVLSEPLRRTGAFLPLLPALGFWVLASNANYPLVLVSVGILYLLLSLWRKSWVYSAAAAIAGNGALWALLNNYGLSIVGHPQMWLIPPALSVLAAVQINRNRLSDAQLTGIRYLAVMVIYASSTGELFIAGVGESLWLPMMLATLSVAGVLAGIVLRVRAFLYLGSSFLMLSVVSMVWHAARNIGHVWPWWAFGILLGLAILTLFALFEKKRNEMLRVIAELRDWEK